MFCPDCGTENSRGTKFCTRCGSNLLAIDRLRDVIGTTENMPYDAPSSSTILKIVALISILGMAIVTLGVIFLSIITQHQPGESPVPFFFGLGGLLTIVLICRYLLRMIQPAATAKRGRVFPAAPPQAAIRAATNRQLSEQVPYQSIVEERTKQFEGDR